MSICLFVSLLRAYRHWCRSCSLHSVSSHFASQQGCPARFILANQFADGGAELFCNAFQCDDGREGLRFSICERALALMPTSPPAPQVEVAQFSFSLDSSPIRFISEILDKINCGSKLHNTKSLLLVSAYVLLLPVLGKAFIHMVFIFSITSTDIVSVVIHPSHSTGISHRIPLHIFPLPCRVPILPDG